MPLLQYDAKNHLAIFGTIPISAAGGLAADSFITIEKNKNDWELSVGADGEGTRSKNNDNSHSIKITVLQSSMLNDLLSAHRALDRRASNGLGVVPFMLKDLQGRLLWLAQEAWIEKPPSIERGSEVKEQEWIFATLDGGGLIGGS